MIDLNATELSRLIAVPDGVILVRAMNREGQRAVDLVATHLNADGLPTGVPRLLRRTTGPVVALDLSAGSDALWVAWGSSRPAGDAHDEHLVAALRASLDVSSVSPPITVQQFRAMRGDADEMAPQALPRLEVGVLAAADGGAVVVSSAAPTRCAHGEADHASRTPCRAWSVARLSSTAVRSRHGRGVVAHTLGPAALARVGDGFAFAVSSAHVGSRSELIVEALREDQAAPFAGATLWHYRDLRLAAAGSTLYAVAQPTEAAMAQAPLGHIRAFGAGAATTRVRRDRLGGEEWPPLVSRALRCQSGRPVIALRWQGGAATLDPMTYGGALRWSEWVERRELPGLEGGGATPPIAYTGRVLVAYDAGGWNRWRCSARGSIVPAQ